MAPLLRAHDGAGARRYCSSRICTGPTPVARLRRIPAGLVPQLPALHPDAGAAGAGRAPTHWGAGKRNFHSLVLEPLPEEARDELLAAWCRDCRMTCASRSAIARRDSAVRDRDGSHARRPWDCWSAENGGYRPTGPVDALEVPETLHALIAARLDGLDRRGAALSGGRLRARAAFTTASACLRRGPTESELEPLLASLYRKEILTSRGRPALAGARPVRLPARARPEGRVRHAGEKGRKTRHLRAAGPPRGRHRP